MNFRCLSCTQELAGDAAVCPNCQWKVESDYLRVYGTDPPLWIVSAGFMSHGKTSLFDAVESTVQRLDKYLHKEGFYARALDNRTFAQAPLRKDKGETGEDVAPTDVVSRRLLSLHQLGSIADKYLSLWDVPGEIFDSLDRPPREVPAIALATVWLVVSLDDIANSGRTLSGLFQSVEAAIRQLGASPVAGHERNVVVVYTKADKWIFPEEIAEYLRDDPLSQQLSNETGGVNSKPLELREYLKKMWTQSSLLRDYTRNLPNGSALLNMAKARNYRLSFAAVSDRMDAPLLNKNGKRSRWSRRVIDPLLLSIFSEAPDQLRSAIRFAVLADATASPGPLYEGASLLPNIHEALRTKGEVTVFYLGQPTPAARFNQKPPTENSRFQRLRLAGSILESLPGPEWHVLALANGPIVDLQDFRADWAKRLRVVRLDSDAEAERWPDKVLYRPGDTAATIVTEWLQSQS